MAEDVDKGVCTIHTAPGSQQRRVSSEKAAVLGCLHQEASMMKSTPGSQHQGDSTKDVAMQFADPQGINKGGQCEGLAVEALLLSKRTTGYV